MSVVLPFVLYAFTLLMLVNADKIKNIIVLWTLVFNLIRKKNSDYDRVSKLFDKI